MNRSTPSLLKPTLALITLLGSLVLASCGSSEQALQLKSSVSQAPNEASVTSGSAPTQPPKPTNDLPQSRPQLVKTAEIALVVNSMDDTLRKASDIVKQQQGDILGLQDDKPENGSRQTASIQIRVPQENLEPTLDALAKLGSIQRRKISAEDVTNQLVDIQARLRNLRQTEASLLQIMKRSGSVGDVLKVAKELSDVRQSIEQIDAQFKNLANRVDYSVITLQLQAAISTTTAQPPLGLQVRDTWNNATHSMGELTTGLLRLGIWLIAYSPYLLLLAGVLWFSYSRRRRQPPRATTRSSDTNLS
jgi:hypothetical protein